MFLSLSKTLVKKGASSARQTKRAILRGEGQLLRSGRGIESGRNVKAGDLVRFRAPHFVRMVDSVTGTEGQDKNALGLLIEYNTWEKVATVMYKGNLLRIAARDVEKFGKRGLNI